MKSFVLTVAVALTHLSVATGAVAQDFPDGNAPVTTEALTAAMSGKTFTVNASKGPPWRWQFNSYGYFFITIGSFTDEGKWSAKDGSLCTEGKKIKASCNEIRAVGSDLYMKRDNGEVVKLIVQ